MAISTIYEGSHLFVSCSLWFHGLMRNNIYRHNCGICIYNMWVKYSSQCWVSNAYCVMKSFVSLILKSFVSLIFSNIVSLESSVEQSLVIQCITLRRFSIIFIQIIRGLQSRFSRRDKVVCTLIDDFSKIVWVYNMR